MGFAALLRELVYGKLFPQVSDMTISVKFSDVIDAVEMLSDAPPYSVQAFLDKNTGVVYWQGDAVSDEEEPPGDLSDDERYLAIPNKNDLDLGSQLVFRFVENQLPDEYDKVRGFFARPGAYSRFKNLLERRGKLDSWYRFEEESINEAVCEWAASKQIPIDGGAPSAA